jgi:hypothetical protein
LIAFGDFIHENAGTQQIKGHSKTALHYNRDHRLKPRGTHSRPTDKALVVMRVEIMLPRLNEDDSCLDPSIEELKLLLKGHGHDDKQDSINSSFRQGNVRQKRR